MQREIIVLAERDHVVVDAWLSMITAQLSGQPCKKHFWAYNQIMDWCSREPLRAWRNILKALDTAQSQDVREQIAVGPLEDLLREHGEALIDALEAEAVGNPGLRNVLGRMMLEGDTPVWERIYAAGAKNEEQAGGAA